MPPAAAAAARALLALLVAAPPRQRAAAQGPGLGNKGGVVWMQPDGVYSARINVPLEDVVKLAEWSCWSCSGMAVDKEEGWVLWIEQKDLKKPQLMRAKLYETSTPEVFGDFTAPTHTAYGLAVDVALGRVYVSTYAQAPGAGMVWRIYYSDYKGKSAGTLTFADWPSDMNGEPSSAPWGGGLAVLDGTVYQTANKNKGEPLIWYWPSPVKVGDWTATEKVAGIAMVTPDTQIGFLSPAPAEKKLYYGEFTSDWFGYVIGVDVNGGGSTRYDVDAGKTSGPTAASLLHPRLAWQQQSGVRLKPHEPVFSVAQEDDPGTLIVSVKDKLVLVTLSDPNTYAGAAGQLVLYDPADSLQITMKDEERGIGQVCWWPMDPKVPSTAPTSSPAGASRAPTSGPMNVPTASPVAGTTAPVVAPPSSITPTSAPAPAGATSAPVPAKPPSSVTSTSAPAPAGATSAPAPAGATSAPAPAKPPSKITSTSAPAVPAAPVSAGTPAPSSKVVAAPLPPSTVDDEEESSSGFWIGLLIGVILCLVVALVCGLYVHKLRKRLEFLEISKLSRSCPVSAPLIDEEEKPPEQPAEPAPPPPAPLPPPPPLVDPGETVDASIGVEWVAEEKKAGDRRSSTGSFTGSDILAAVAPIHVSEWNTGPAKPVGAAGRSGGAPASAGRPRRRQSNGSEKGAAPRGEGPHPAVHSPTGRPRRRQSSGSEKGAASHSPQWPEEERRGPAGAAPGTPLPAGRAAALAALAQVPPRSVTTPASALHDHPGPDADADAAGNLGVYAAPGREGSPKAAWERRQGTRQQKPVGPPPRHAASDAARSATTASPLAPPKSYYNVNFGAPATASTLPSASPLTAGRGSGTAGAPARAPAPIDPITDLLNMQTVAPPGRRNVRAADSRDRAGRGQGV